MRPAFILVLTSAALLGATPANGQDRKEATWELTGLGSSFCVQFLLDPASEALKGLPQGYRPAPASAAPALHVSLRSVVEGQQEFGAWAPSRLCFTTADTITTPEFRLTGRHQQLFGMWTVLVTGPSGAFEDLALDLFTNNGRLARAAARATGHLLHDAGLKTGKVPAMDENGVKSTDDRFEVKADQALVTWDGRSAGDSTAVSEPARAAWAARTARGAIVHGQTELSPAYSEPMVGSLKVDGNSVLAKALRASPTRFAGPAYHGGAGKVTFTR